MTHPARSGMRSDLTTEEWGVGHWEWGEWEEGGVMGFGDGVCEAEGMEEAGRWVACV